MFVHPLHYYPCITFPPFRPNLHIVIRLVGSSRTFMEWRVSIYRYAWQPHSTCVMNFQTEEGRNPYIISNIANTRRGWCPRTNLFLTWDINLGSMSARPRDLDLALTWPRSEAGAGLLSGPSPRDILPITDLKNRFKIRKFQDERAGFLTRFEISFKYFG